jgi:hypothetical protein
LVKVFGRLQSGKVGSGVRRTHAAPTQHSQCLQSLRPGASLRRQCIDQTTGGALSCSVGMAEFRVGGKSSWVSALPCSVDMAEFRVGGKSSWSARCPAVLRPTLFIYMSNGTMGAETSDRHVIGPHCACILLHSCDRIDGGNGKKRGPSDRHVIGSHACWLQP